MELSFQLLIILNTASTDGTLGFLASKLNDVGRLHTGEPKHFLDCKKKQDT